VDLSSTVIASSLQEGNMLYAKDIMTHTVSTVTPDATVREALKLLEATQLSGAPVVGDDGVKGVISMSDIADLLVNAPESAANTSDSVLDEHTVAELMTSDIVSVTPDTSVRTVAGIMRNRAIHRILVMEGRQLCGIISAIDIARAVSEKGVGGNTGVRLAPRSDSTSPWITL